MAAIKKPTPTPKPKAKFNESKDGGFRPTKPFNESKDGGFRSKASTPKKPTPKQPTPKKPTPKVLKAGPTLSGEVFTPGSLVRGVAKVVAKVTGKKAAAQQLTRTKIMANAEKKAEAMKISKTVAKKPNPSVKAVPARGSSYNKVANQKEAERIARTKSKTTSKDLRGTARQDYEVAKIPVSKNLTARVPAKSNYEFAKDMSRFGKIQKQNAGPLQATKAEAKANARGLKAANKKK